ncbi:unnamed protein product [Merluccius merluccius]
MHSLKVAASIANKDGCCSSSQEVTTNWAQLQLKKKAGLVINAKKCHIAMAEVKYLGYVIGGGVICPQIQYRPRHKNVIADFLSHSSEE